MLRRFSIAAVIVFLSACSQVSNIVQPRISQNSAVVQLVNQARDHSASNQYAMAESKLERALRLEPKNAALWFELAFVNEDQNKLVEAKSMAERAKRLSTNPSLTRNIELFLRDLGSN